MPEQSIPMEPAGDQSTLDKDQQKELLREVQTLLQDAVPDDFDEWLEKQQAIKVKP